MVKSLSSCGLVINETHRLILEAHDLGLSVDDIAHRLGIHRKTVQAYFPRTRPVYNECLTTNAKRIKKCREKKKRESNG